ncbi:MAG TPA: putative zinc-binding metallopeptidase [Puia sp.]|nr:putative zinc-binding metallopeptidase [Puia sp.]
MQYPNLQQQPAKVIPISMGRPGPEVFKPGAFEPGVFETYNLAPEARPFPLAGRFGKLLLALGSQFSKMGLFLIRNGRKLPLLLFLLGSMVSCKKSDSPGDVSNIPGLGGDSSATTAIDQWIYDTLTVPFNVTAKYRWDQFELDLNKTLTPPMESKIIPVLSAMKQVWIDTYVAEAGLNFMKTLIPKFFILVGSASWNTDGTITLGSAEGGRQIDLYVLNNFRTKSMPGYQPSDSFNIKQMFHTIEHEFGHILHQTVLYPIAYRTITVGLYTANWNNVSDGAAQADGFISAYAMAAPDEDFVETISIMLTEGRAGFDNIVNGIPPGFSADGVSQADAQSRLRQKEAIVVSYFKDVWNIDFYSLQARVRAQVVSLIQ